MKSSYKAVILGLGNIAWRFDESLVSGILCRTHASALLKHSRVKLVGGCSDCESDRQAFQTAFSIPVFESCEKIIDEMQPDIVSICTPSIYHFEHAKMCIEQEIPMIWLEKPPTSQTNEIDILLDKQKKRGMRSKILVNYQRRYSRKYQYLRKILTEKAFGECLKIQITYSQGLELNGSHLLDILFFILNDMSGYNLEWASGEEDVENPSFSLRFHNDLHVLVSGVNSPYHCIDISLIGERGRISILHGGMTIRVEQKKEHEWYPGFYRLSDQLDESTVSEQADDEFFAALDDLITAFEANRNPRSSLCTARHAQILIDQVRQLQSFKIAP